MGPGIQNSLSHKFWKQSMKININLNSQQESNPVQTQKKNGVVMGRITRVREMLDINGNVIDPKTKQIIKRNVEEKLILPK